MPSTYWRVDGNLRRIFAKTAEKGRIPVTFLPMLQGSIQYAPTPIVGGPMNDVFLTDNGLQRAIPGALNYRKDPDADTQALTNATADADDTVTVVGGKRYLLIAVATGGFYAGLETVATAANVQWVAALGQPGVVITVPLGKTTLHYAVTANSAKGYLIPLA